MLEHTQCAKGIFDGLIFSVMVCALRDGLKSFCDCGLCFGHALGLERGTRWGLTAEEILVSNDNPTLSQKSREGWGTPKRELV